MKKVLLFISCLFSFTVALAQREFWGLTNSNTDYWLENNNGAIFKTDVNGQNRQVVHLFDEIHGKNPKARLFAASNGKLYGTTFKGGEFFSAADSGGVLFEYDPVTGRYRVVANFGGNGLTREPFTDLIEPIPGVLFGASQYRVFRYDMATDVTTISITMPEYNNGNYNLNNNINDQLVKASDGFVYGVTAGAAGCVGSSSQAAGTIIRIDPENNTYTQPYLFPCYPNDSGYYPIGSLVEGTPGKLYGTTEVGGNNGDGVLFEFNITTNTYTKKFDFEESVSGKSPRSLIDGGNGKLYGITLEGGTNACDPNQHIGTLFEYDIANNTIATVVNMGCDGNFSAIGRPHGTLLKASTGYIFGISGQDMNDWGIFKFDPVTNTAVNACPLCPNVPNLLPVFSEGLIEICRKPSYRYFENANFRACSGSQFIFDVHNTNATSYIWRKDGITLPLQTTAVLNFTAITVSDSGVYTCEMVNECGTTTIPAITIGVNPSDAATITSVIPATGNTIFICPGENAILSGNDHAGTWSTGETTSSILVSQPGDYQIINTNTCGNTYSNTVAVALHQLPPPITILYTNILCLGSSVTLSGNVEGGVWQDGSTGNTLTVPLELNREYYVTLRHPCGTVTSNIIEFHESDLGDDPVPEIVINGPSNICSGNSVVLNSNYPGSNANNFWRWYRTGSVTEIGVGASVTVTEPGTYFLERTSFCFGTVASQLIIISAATGPPDVPVITANNVILTGTVLLCEGDIVESSGEYNLWNTGETTPFITVSAGGYYSVTAINNCGSAISENIEVLMVPLPYNAIIQEGNSLVAAEVNMFYQWLDCTEITIIERANSQSFTPERPGRYAVEITNSTGCSVMSECYAFGALEISDIAKGRVALYPNPAKEKITLQTSAIIEKITIINMLGQTVASATNATEVDTSSLAHGQYILIAQTDSGTWRGKFVKN